MWFQRDGSRYSALPTGGNVDVLFVVTFFFLRGAHDCDKKAVGDHILFPASCNEFNFGTDTQAGATTKADCCEQENRLISKW